MAIFSAISSQLVLIGLNLFGATAAGWAAATAFANIVIGAALLGASALLTSSRAPTMRTPQAQAVINQSAGPRIRGYGWALLGGTRAFWDSKNGYLYQVVMAHSGEIDAFVSFRVGDIEVSLDSNGYVTNGAFDIGSTRFVLIRSHRGEVDQARDDLIFNAWPQWSDAHQLKGIAYFVTRYGSPVASEYQKMFPDGYNTQTKALCRLSKVFDPRDPAQFATDESTWTWSDNAALAILDYLKHPDGYRRSIDDIDVDSFAAFANVCDQEVARAAGGTEKRYRLWGVYQLTDEPQAVLDKMRRACDAELYQTAEGKIAIRGGNWQAPTVTITEDMILGHSMEEGSNRFAAFNELKILYTSPDHDYQTVEAQAWIDLADQAERGVIASDLDLDFVPSPSQARRLAKIHISKANPRWKGRVRANLSALDALGERTVRVVISELGIDDAFFISKFEIAPDLTGVELELITISEAAYTWDAETEEGVNPAIPQDTSPELEFPVPQGLTLSQPVVGTILATVTPSERTDLVLEVEIRKGAGSLWQTMETQADNYTANLEPATAGTYQARARWSGPQGTASEWSSPLAEITI